MNKAMFRTIYCIAMLLFICWIAFSNRILSKQVEFSAEEDSMLNYKMKDKVWYCFDQCLENGDLLETVGMIGWAFTETDQDNPNAYTELIFANESECYSLKSKQQAYTLCSKRNDVVKAFAELHISSENVGFAKDFTTINMKDGVYNVYIYRFENEYNYGIAQTEKQLVKKGAEVQIREWRSMDASIVEPNSVIVPREALDSVTVSDNSIELIGWMYIPDMETNTQKVYYRLRGESFSDYYTTRFVQRDDVAKTFANDKYKVSGYVGRINLDTMTEQEFEVTFFVENGETVCEGKTYRVVIEGEEVSIEQL